MREKLIELLGGDMCQDLCCCECEYETDDKGCIEELKQRMADHLIAHGVTIQTEETDFDYEAEVE